MGRLLDDTGMQTDAPGREYIQLMGCKGRILERELKVLSDKLENMEQNLNSTVIQVEKRDKRVEECYDEILFWCEEHVINNIHTKR